MSTCVVHHESILPGPQQQQQCPLSMQSTQVNWLSFTIISVCMRLLECVTWAVNMGGWPGLPQNCCVSGPLQQGKRARLFQLHAAAASVCKMLYTSTCFLCNIASGVYMHQAVACPLLPRHQRGSLACRSIQGPDPCNSPHTTAVPTPGTRTVCMHLSCQSCPIDCA